MYNIHFFKKFSLHFQGCVDTFQISANMNGANGQQQAGISTNAACEAACREKPFAECGAYDFNTNANTCWFFTTEPSSLNDANGVNHYKREQCGGMLHNGIKPVDYFLQQVFNYLSLLSFCHFAMR